MSDRHLLDIERLDTAAIERILERSCALAAGASARPLAATAASLFYEPSTRTRVSFELAAGRLGMRMVTIELEHSSCAKGETLDDTVATLAAMGVDAVAVRHPQNHRVSRLAESVGGRVKLINAGDGTHAHPSQALLDAAALRARGVAFAGLKLAIVGDIKHSRVAASALALWPRLGAAEIRLAGPPAMLPDRLPVAAASLHASLAEAVRDVDVVIVLRIQHERIDRAGWPDRAAYFADWGLTEDKLAHSAPGCLVMHPGPINRGVEIDAAVADGARSLILEQVRMGVFTRMAIFEWLFEK